MPNIKEIELNHRWLTPPEYERLTGLPHSRAKIMCDNGELIHTKTKGGHYLIRVNAEDQVVPYEKYESLLRRNAELEAMLKQIANTTASMFNEDIFKWATKKATG